MKKSAIIILTFLLSATLLSGCSSAPKQKDSIELIVFAAASMTETLTQIGELYKDVAPNVTLTFTFDSSGTLKTQIEEGADCDIFISASPKQMNELDCVLTDTRVDLLENKVVLTVPEGNPASINSYADLIKKLEHGSVLLAIGNSDVPVGQYTQKIFSHFGLNEKNLAANGILTYGSNAKEVTIQVSEATVDCGIIYATDAAASGLSIIDTATAEMCGQVIYPATVLNITQQEDAARAFLEYLKGDAAGAIFESVGFTPIHR